MHACVYINVCLHACVYIYVCMHACVYICVYVSMPAYTVYVNLTSPDSVDPRSKWAPPNKNNAQYQVKLLHLGAFTWRKRRAGLAHHPQTLHRAQSRWPLASPRSALAPSTTTYQSGKQSPLTIQDGNP